MIRIAIREKKNYTASKSAGETPMVIRLLPAALLMALVAQAAEQPSAPTATVPQRLVSTDAAATEILQLLGVSERLVAVDASSELPAGQSLPRLGYHRALSAEGLISLAPDLVIGSEHMGPPHVLEALARAEVPVLKLDSPESLPTLIANIEAIANATGSRGGAVLAERLRGQSVQLADQALLGQKAAFLLRAEGGKLRLAGSGTAGAGFLDLLGADNVAEHANYRSVTPEALLALAPDLLVLADAENLGSQAFIEQFPVLRFSPAVRDGRLFAVDAGTLVAGISVAAVTEAGRIQQAARQQFAEQAN
jgi:iron complex transport system substrate-binding protein